MSKLRWLILLVLVLVAGALALVWFLLQPDPKVIFKQAQRNLINATGLHEVVTLDVSGDVTSTILSGASGKGSVGELRGVVVTDADMRAFPMSSTSTFQFSLDGGDGQTTRLAGSSAKKDGMHYLKVTDASALAGTDAAKLAGGWLKTPMPILQLLFPLSEADAALPSLTPEQAAKMRAALADADIFTLIGKPTLEEGTGVGAVWHYHVQLNQDNAVALLLAMHGLQTGVPVSPEDQTRALIEVQAWGEPQGEVVIGRKDRRIRSVTLATTLTGGSAATVKAQADFSMYGERVSFALPLDAVDLAQAAAAPAANLKSSGLRSQTPGSASATAPLTTAPDGTASTSDDDDADGLSNSQEFFYGSDVWNPDTDGDGYSDGVEVAHGMNPVGPGSLFGFGLGR